MDFLLKFLFFVSCAFSSIDSSQSNSDSSMFKCNHGSIDLQYPFTSGIHEFNLLCKNNMPAIRFQSYGELGVKSISYPLKKLDLIDPRNCVHEVFLNLDLSNSIFKYYYVVKKYTYLNCSTRLPSSPSFQQIPCLSGTHHHIYTVENITTFAALESSCVILKTVAIPFSYSPYLSDNSFGLSLTWDLPELQETAEMGSRSESSNLIVICLGIMTLAMALTMVTGLVIHSSRKQESVTEEEVTREEIRKLIKASDMVE